MSTTRKKTKKEKPVKVLCYICYDCAIQLYSKNIRTSDRLSNITIWEDKCSICGKKTVIVPLRDYLYAQGEGVWD